MAERIRDTYMEPTGKDTRVIDHLVHEIQNNLQVISMEAELRLMGKRSKRGPQCAFDAAQNIERLLGEVRQYFYCLNEASPEGRRRCVSDIKKNSS